MSFRNVMVVMLTAMMLTGCATRGAIKITCADFRDRYVTTIKPSSLVLDIQSDTQSTLRILRATREMPRRETDTLSPLAQSIVDILRDPNGIRVNLGTASIASPQTPSVLLLSGGGQWGAFGAGFLGRLHDLGEGKLPNFGTITGVSTGGLQSLFVAIDRQDASAYDRLRQNYLPSREKDVVDRNPRPLAIIPGSLAGLKPLRRKIEEALCVKGDPARGCRMIDQLSASERRVFVGFVRASTGEFEYADAVAIAAQGAGTASIQRRRSAQQCLTGIALASAAMPVFFQQVRINGETYYDGGVRQSVFEENVAADLDRAARIVRADTITEQGTDPGLVSPDLYVVRNGPTQLLGGDGKPEPDPAVDKKADALSNAFRAEAIVVNQLEVGSIAALRLAHPTGSIRLVTADGYDRWARPGEPSGTVRIGCQKTGGVMFDPIFMRCLQDFGRAKAERTYPWKELGALDVPADARDRPVP